MNASTSVRAAGVTDPDEAQRLVTEVFISNRISLPRDSASLDMNLAATRLGELSSGLLSYGESVHMVTADLDNFHVDLPLRGRAKVRTGKAATVGLEWGLAGVFPPGAPATISWSKDCEMVCLMVPRHRLEEELEGLLGRSLRGPLSFDSTMDLRSETGQVWRPALLLIRDVLTGRSGLADLPAAARHIESVVLDGLLVGQRHNYTEQLSRTGSSNTTGAVARAAALVQERPGEPWSTVRLAQAVRLSVRALQEGFRRELGTPPMAYLRDLRLQRVREALVQADPRSTTVRSVAMGFGFSHVGRFATTYRHMYDETPSTTLARPV